MPVLEDQVGRLLSVPSLLSRRCFRVKREQNQWKEFEASQLKHKARAMLVEVNHAIPIEQIKQRLRDEFGDIDSAVWNKVMPISAIAYHEKAHKVMQVMDLMEADPRVGKKRVKGDDFIHRSCWINQDRTPSKPRPYTPVQAAEDWEEAPQYAAPSRFA